MIPLRIIDYIYNKNNVQSAYFKVYLKQLQFLKPNIFQENASNKLNLTHPFNVLLTFAAIGYILAIYIFPYFCAKEMRVIINAKQVIVYFNYSRGLSYNIFPQNAFFYNAMIVLQNIKSCNIKPDKIKMAMKQKTSVKIYETHFSRVLPILNGMNIYV